MFDIARLRVKEMKRPHRRLDSLLDHLAKQVKAILSSQNTLKRIILFLIFGGQDHAL